MAEKLKMLKIKKKHCRPLYLLFVNRIIFFVVITGSTDGIGKATAFEVK